MISETQIAYGSRVRRHGRSRWWARYHRFRRSAKRRTSIPARSWFTVPPREDLERALSIERERKRVRGPEQLAQIVTGDGLHGQRDPTETRVLRAHGQRAVAVEP